MFVLSATAMELLLVLTIWTNPELSQASVAVEGFCALGIRFQAGGFHTLMALLTAAGWLAASVFCREYMVHVHKRNRFYFFWMLTLGATMGVFLSADLFTAFVFFEVMSFTSFVLVIQTEEYQALKAGETYLAVAVIGGLAALAGLFLLYGQLGTLDLDQMGAAAAAVEDRTVLWRAPCWYWWASGRRRGPSPCTSGCPPPPGGPRPSLGGALRHHHQDGSVRHSGAVHHHLLYDGAWGLLLAAIGAVTMVLGAVLAVCSIDLKRTLACSSISQIGFYSGGDGHDVPAGGAQRLAVDGTILHILNHSLIKMVLFPLAGIIHLSTHSFDLNEIRALAGESPCWPCSWGCPCSAWRGCPPSTAM